ELVASNDAELLKIKDIYSNLYTTYAILIASYRYEDAITDLSQMKQYYIRQIEIYDVQKRFLNIVGSNKAADINAGMANLRDLNQIKKLFHL
ncbi:MAG: hypothetical protein KBT04_07525, partial [Bacteroidales bacterium]|nr:hypothetical protein [Candidatus Colimorpha onthohippi]